MDKVATGSTVVTPSVLESEESVGLRGVKDLAFGSVRTPDAKLQVISDPS